MERFLTVSVASLCAAPLFFILTLQFIEPLIKQFLPAGLGSSLDRSLLFSVGLSLFGFILVAGLAWYFAGHGYMRPDRPNQSMDWSDWEVPVPHEYGTTPKGLTLRYRLLIMPMNTCHS